MQQHLQRAKAPLLQQMPGREVEGALLLANFPPLPWQLLHCDASCLMHVPLPDASWRALYVCPPVLQSFWVAGTCRRSRCLQSTAGTTTRSVSVTIGLAGQPARNLHPIAVPLTAASLSSLPLLLSACVSSSVPAYCDPRCLLLPACLLLPLPTSACLPACLPICPASCILPPSCPHAAAVADRITAQLKEETTYLRSVSQVQFPAVQFGQYALGSKVWAPGFLGSQFAAVPFVFCWRRSSC